MDRDGRTGTNGGPPTWGAGGMGKRGGWEALLAWYPGQATSQGVRQAVGEALGGRIHFPK